MVLQKNEHGNQIEVLAHKGAFYLAERIIYFARAKSHLEGEELSGRAERSKNHADVQAHYYAYKAFANEQKHIFKIEVSGRGNELCILRICSSACRNLRTDKERHVCSQCNFCPSRNC